ncbi:DUF6716 putative glycosyltransferase [Stappia sp.]|uniref:DUF6716 putative glycosyltransferase n=1 Tax=Stappia sp. TaxID=1870903 RepID=UPI0032D8F23A
MKVLALAGYDSFLNTVRLIAPYFRAEGCDVDFALVKARQRKQISSVQIDEMGLAAPVRTTTIDGLFKNDRIASYDIVLSCLEGMSTRRLFRHLAALPDKRPFVISVYPGLLLRYAYDGLSMRAPADRLWLNCPRDMDAYTAMCAAFGIDASNARVLGNGSVLERIDRRPDAADGPVVFFEQAIIPRYYEERKFLIEQLCALARRNPGREILIKARAAGKKATLHRTWHPIEHLLDEAAQSPAGVPDNLRLTEERASELLSRAAHCLTISSTVAVEALHAGVPTTLISDFGAHDDYGLPYFFGSGLLRPFDQVDLDAPPTCDDAWLSHATGNPTSTVAQLARDAVDAARMPHGALDPQRFTPMNSLAFETGIMKAWGMTYLIDRKFKSKRMPFSDLLRRFHRRKT